MTTMTTTDLIEAVAAIVRAEPVNGGKCGFEFLEDHAPDRPPRDATDVELCDHDSHNRDWGFVYGVALGIARGQDPYESSESVAARAFEAATSRELRGVYRSAR
jgi:hypothetical protein